MRTRVAVVGANGRVGRAICSRLQAQYDVVPIARETGDDVRSIADRATSGVHVVVNAAGVAHLSDASGADRQRLQAGNVDLPIEIARRCSEAGVAFLHVSSIKAVDLADQSPYAISKREAEWRLQDDWSGPFVDAGLRLIIVRPLALLFPPLNAGKVSRLRWLARVPSWLVPPLRLPVLTPTVFLDEIVSSIETLIGEVGDPGVAVRDFRVSQRGNLRSLRSAFVAAAQFRDVGDERNGA